MKRYSIIVLIVVLLMAGQVFASGTFVVTSVTILPNCSGVGDALIFGFQAVNYTGHHDLRLYANGELKYSQSVDYVNITFANPAFSVPSIWFGAITEHTIYRAVMVEDGVTMFDLSWDCSTGQLVGGASGTRVNFSDGRINNHDGAAPIAVYPNSGGVDIFAIGSDSKGTLVIHLTQAEIDAVGVPAENTLLGASADGSISVWRLSTGEFQIVAPTASGKTYTLIFSKIETGSAYTSSEG